MGVVVNELFNLKGFVVKPMFPFIPVSKLNPWAIFPAPDTYTAYLLFIQATPPPLRDLLKIDFTLTTRFIPWSTQEGFTDVPHLPGVQPMIKAVNSINSSLGLGGITSGNTIFPIGPFQLFPRIFYEFGNTVAPLNSSPHTHQFPGNEFCEGLPAQFITFCLTQLRGGWPIRPNIAELLLCYTDLAILDLFTSCVNGGETGGAGTPDPWQYPTL